MVLEFSIMGVHMWWYIYDMDVVLMSDENDLLGSIDGISDEKIDELEEKTKISHNSSTKNDEKNGDDDKEKENYNEEKENDDEDEEDNTDEIVIEDDEDDEDEKFAGVDELVQKARKKLGIVAEESEIGSNTNTDLPAELRILSQYIPKETDLAQKTKVPNIKVANMISILRCYPDMFPELDDERTRKVFDKYFNQLEKRLTSVEGESRDEYTRIFESLLSGVSYKHEDRDDGLGETLFGTRGDDDE